MRFVYCKLEKSHQPKIGRVTNSWPTHKSILSPTKTLCVLKFVRKRMFPGILNILFVTQGRYSTSENFQAQMDHLVKEDFIFFS